MFIIKFLRRVQAVPAIAFILRLGIALTANSATCTTMICVVGVSKARNDLYDVDSASDPVTASLMAEDVQTVMKKSRPSQRKAGHDTAIRSASDFWATRPQPSSISEDVPCIHATPSRCAGNLDKDEYYSNTRVQTTESRCALTLPPSADSSSESCYRRQSSPSHCNKTFFAGAQFATPGKRPY